ncbi:unnamed protein product [Owenia fusiformis]|uniref:Hexosyltransferase n=1 Tax=Owenia fusiformis TaxID=6347 RepID=A0A8J1TF32_OWEFU|nr:unnamed protein product [Owenia fusiformis]
MNMMKCKRQSKCILMYVLIIGILWSGSAVWKIARNTLTTNTNCKNITKGLQQKFTASIAKIESIFHINSLHQQNNRSLSQSNDFTILILVCSNPKNTHLRKAIRKTWLSMKHPTPNITIKYRFVIGNTDDNSIQENIKTEIDKFDDIVHGDFVDSYLNLTIKTLYAMKWAIFNEPNVNYVLKADDDAFINIFNIPRFLYEKQLKRTCLGYMITNVPPDRNPASKWYVPKSSFPNPIYPAFTAGWAYVISMDMLPELYKTAKATNFFYLEDIFLTGICRSKIKGKVMGNANFKARLDSSNDDEVKTFFAVHFTTEKNHYEYWKAQKRVGSHNLDGNEI